MLLLLLLRMLLYLLLLFVLTLLCKHTESHMIAPGSTRLDAREGLCIGAVAGVGSRVEVGACRALPCDEMIEKKRFDCKA